MTAPRARGMVRDLRSPLLRNAFYLSLNEIVSAAFGLAFWVVAARLYPDADVGRGTALVSVGALLGVVASLGFTIALVRFVPTAGERRGAFVATGLLLTVGAASAAAGVFLVGVRLWTPALADVLGEPWRAALFAAFVAGWGFFIVLDAGFIGTGEARRVLFRGALQTALKLVLLVPLAGILGDATLGLFLAWTAAQWTANGAGLLLARRTRSFGAVRWRIDRGAARHMARFAAGNHAATLLGGMIGLVMPVVVLHELGPGATAHFYVAWTMANLLYMLPASVQTSVLAESSRRETLARTHTRTGLRWTYAVLAPASVVAYLVAPWILGIFSATYVAATDLLRILILNGFAQALNGAYQTWLRVERRLVPLIAISAAITTGSLGSAALLLPAYGLAGAGLAILGTQLALAAVSAVGLRAAKDVPASVEDAV